MGSIYNTGINPIKKQYFGKGKTDHVDDGKPEGLSACVFLNYSIMAIINESHYMYKTETRCDDDYLNE